MIRKSLYCAIIIAITAIVFQGCKKEAIETTTVKSPRGLVLRKGPDISAEKIMLLPDRAPVAILTYSNSISVIDGKTAPWVEIRYKDKEGWVFSAYLANYVSQGYDDMSKLGTFAESPFIKSLYPATIGSGLKDSIMKNLPEKGEVKSIDKENRHDPAITDRHHTITAPGLTVTVYEAVKLKKELIEGLVITGNQIPMKHGVSIGMSTSELEKIFGPPAEKKNGEYTYSSSDAVPVTVIFYFSSDKLEKILLAYRVD